MKKILSVFKETFLCIWALIKEIITAGVYAKKHMLLLIIMFVLFLLAFGIGISFDFPVWLIITIGIIILILFNSLYAIIYGDFKKTFCKVPVVAKIIDTMNLRQVSDDTPYYEHKNHVLILEYKYKNKTYKKHFEVLDSDFKAIGSEINIMISERFPKIMYIVKDKIESDSISKLGFEKWYMHNRLPDDLKDKIIYSYKKNTKEQTMLTIINLLFSFICIALFYILIGKNYNFDTIFVFYLIIWLFSFVVIFLITNGLHNLVIKNTPYSIYSKLIRKKVVYELESEEAEQKFIQALRKKI